MATLVEQPKADTRPALNFPAGLWRLADPKISLASIASMFLGACAAAHDGPIAWGWLAATVLGIFAIEVAKNASGELFDFASGADPAVAPEDRSPFSGGKRVLVDGLLTPGQTAAIAIACYGIGAATGIVIALLREPAVLWLGVAGGALAYFYHAPPLKLSYRGLGEVAVAVCYGPLLVAGTYVVQRGTVTPSVLLLSAPLGLLIGAFLWINEFPDFAADRVAGKKTLVVRLGRDRARYVFLHVVVAAGLLAASLPMIGLPRAVWLGLVAFVPALRAAAILLAHSEETARIIPAQRLALAAFVLLSAGTGIGLAFWR